MSYLMVQDGDGHRPATRQEILFAARQAAKLPSGTNLSSPKNSKDYLIARLAGLDHEVFGVILLTTRNRLIKERELFRGTIDGASVHPREVVKEALAAGAAAIVIYHNHPSGSPEPSHADEVITHRLKEACALIDVRVLDHLIIAGDQCTSLAERGLL